MSKWAFINNEIVPEEKAVIKINDLSIGRAYGIFDFFKIANGQPVFLKDHLDRFYASAEKMHLQVSQTRDDMSQAIELLVQKNAVKDCGIRITLTGGYATDGYKPVQPNLLISVHDFKIPDAADINKGIVLVTKEYQRQFPEVKTIDYIMAIWLQPELKKAGADDVLYVSNQIITECPRANIFMITGDDRLVTPSRNILKGITRKKILDAASADFKIEERDISLQELLKAREIFICSTTRNILPVNKINEVMLPVQKSATLRLLQLLLQAQKPSVYSSFTV